MNIAFKPKLSLSQAKKLIRTIKTEGGSLRRVNAECASLKDRRGFTMTLTFKSNLELRGLI